LQGTLTIDTYNGATKIGTKSISITVMTNEEVCKPSLSATVVDSNSATIAITGDKNRLVKHKSTAKVQITTSAKNSATISIKRVNGQTVTDNTVEIQNTENNVFTIEVTDSRGYSNTVTVTKTMIDYMPLSISANIVRKNPTSSEALLSFSGNYFNSKIGNTTNTLQITWKYKLKSATEYSTAKTITPTITNNTFSGSKISLGSLFNYQNTYDIQITAKDKLTTIITTVALTRGIPVINWGKDFFNINGKFLINGKEKVKSTVLYENTAGLLGNVPLSDNVSNYEYLEVHYVSDDFYNSITVRNPAGKKICLFNNYYTNNQQCMYMSVFNISSNSLNHVASRNNFINQNDIVGNYGNNQYIRIVSVIGRN